MLKALTWAQAKPGNAVSYLAPDMVLVLLVRRRRKYAVSQRVFCVSKFFPTEKKTREKNEVCFFFWIFLFFSPFLTGAETHQKARFLVATYLGSLFFYPFLTEENTRQRTRFLPGISRFSIFQRGQKHARSRGFVPDIF